jgi:MbtH protein
MPNPFEDTNIQYLVLVNDEGQHSLWPSGTEVPDGWTQVHGPVARDACMAYVRENWTDMRPKSLAEQVSGGGGRA